MLDNVMDFLGSAIPGAILIAILYGIFVLIRKGYKQVKSTFTTENGEVDFQKKKSFFDGMKIFFGAQIVGLLFYITPLINENIKILFSLIATLGAFAGTFFIKEKKGYNGICRVLIFIGQEFFGITMFLMMVNKGMGYSLNSIFFIWTIFNLYISKQFVKIENKMFFVGTLLIWIGTMLNIYAKDVDAYIMIIGLSVILLAMQFFASKEKLWLKFTINFLLTVLLVITLSTITIEENQIAVLVTTLVYLIATMVQVIISEKVNAKAFLIYMPYIALLLLVGFEKEMMALLPIFNILIVIWFLADKSKYKKSLCVIILAYSILFATEIMPDEGITGAIIYISAVILTITCLFAPEKKAKLEEGRDSYEDENN